MNRQHIILLVLLVIAGGAVVWNNQRIASMTNPAYVASPEPTSPQAPVARDCVPTFVDGGGPYYQPNAPFRTNLAPDSTSGQKLVVSGRVLKADCSTPVPSVVLDIWQANESGNYDDEWYRGRLSVSDEGAYQFETVVPKGYGEGTAFRPPHIHFKVWNGSTEIITSQMFLPAARQQQIDEAYIVKLDTMEIDGQPVLYATHDIILPE